MSGINPTNLRLGQLHDHALDHRHKPQTRPHAPPPVQPEQQKPPQESSTSYSEIMREATDGDASEQIAAMAQAAAPRDGSRRDDRRRDSKEKRTQAPSPAAQPEEVEDAPFDPLQKLRMRAEARVEARVSGSEAARAVEQTTRSGSQTTERHENLMVMSSAMKPREIATMVSQQLFEPLRALLSQSHWSPNQMAVDRTVADQMHATFNRLV